jgi:pilus assembly protein CpaC
MHLTSTLRRRIAAGLVALAGWTGPATALQPPDLPGMNQGGDPAEAKVDAKTGALIVPLGGVVKFTPPGMKPIRDITNRNEEVLDARVDVRSPEAVILVGKRGGATQLILVLGGKDDEVRVAYDVVVQPDFELLRSVIRRTVPTATVDIIPGPGSSVVLTGFVSKPEDSDTILRIATDAVGGRQNNLINAIQVGGSQHVLIDVVVALVNRSEARSRGFDFGVTTRNGAGYGSTVSGLLTSFGGTGPGGGAAGGGMAGGGVAAGGAAGAGGAVGGGGAPSFSLLPNGGANIVFGFVPPGFIGALQALRGENLVKFVSEPRVVTQTGRPAFLRVGGRQAILGPASGINGPGAELYPFGTEVEVLPIVMGNGRIYLEINPRISSVNQNLGIDTAFGATPGFNEQQTRSSVTMESGQTFAIGGLIETQVSASARKVPLLGDIPYLGTLFSSVVHTEAETEYIVLVTPRLVEPMDCAQVPHRLPGMETRSPDDYELFLEGLLEAPRGQRQVWTNKKYNAAYKCDPTYGKYPCVGPLCTGGYNGCLPAGGPVVTTSTPAGAASPTPVTPVSGTNPYPTEVPPVVPAPEGMTIPEVNPIR